MGETYKKRRHLIFARDNNECLSCNSKENLTIDHIKPKALGGTSDINNLQTLCEKCNLSKGGRRIIDYRIDKSFLIHTPQPAPMRRERKIVRLANDDVRDITPSDDRYIGETVTYFPECKTTIGFHY